MKPNRYMDADALMLAQVQRRLEQRQLSEQWEPDDGSGHVLVWAVLVGIVWSFTALIWWLA